MTTPPNTPTDKEMVVKHPVVGKRDMEKLESIAAESSKTVPNGAIPTANHRHITTTMPHRELAFAPMPRYQAKPAEKGGKSTEISENIATTDVNGQSVDNKITCDDKNTEWNGAETAVNHSLSSSVTESRVSSQHTSNTSVPIIQVTEEITSAENVDVNSVAENQGHFTEDSRITEATCSEVVQKAAPRAEMAANRAEMAKNSTKTASFEQQQQQSTKVGDEIIKSVENQVEITEALVKSAAFSENTSEKTAKIESQAEKAENTSTDTSSEQSTTVADEIVKSVENQVDITKNLMKSAEISEKLSETKAKIAENTAIIGESEQQSTEVVDHAVKSDETKVEITANSVKSGVISEKQSENSVFYTEQSTKVSEEIVKSVDNQVEITKTLVKSSEISEKQQEITSTTTENPIKITENHNTVMMSSPVPPKRARNQPQSTENTTTTAETTETTTKSAESVLKSAKVAVNAKISHNFTENRHKSGQSYCIVGGGGYIGWSLSQSLIKQGHQVSLFDLRFPETADRYEGATKIQVSKIEGLRRF